jgi:transposase
MSKRRVYRATEVNHVRWESLVAGRVAGAVTVGMDIGKFEILVVVRWADSTFERPWRVENPAGIPQLIGLLRKLRETQALTVALESTGTYGDALRSQLAAADLPVRRVGGKAAHDYAEVFDGVPSQHDGKDAAILAELGAFGKATDWPYVTASDTERDLAYWVDWLDAQQQVQMMWTNRLEPLLARHWPELTRLVPLNSVMLLRMLAHYGGPAAVAADATATEQLARWSRCSARAPRIGRVVASAASTLGVPQARRDIERVRQDATLALAAAREVTRARRQLAVVAQEIGPLQQQGAVVGIATACVLWTCLGSPENYPCAAAYRKAMGLNLKERSSGRHQGQLKITRRGPALVRRWLYFAAMRLAQRAGVRAWYQAKKAKDKDRGKGALIAVARKLALALYYVGARGEVFAACRLFPGTPTLGPPARTAAVPE